jgi:hypothetical protein
LPLFIGAFLICRKWGNGNIMDNPIELFDGINNDFLVSEWRRSGGRLGGYSTRTARCKDGDHEDPKELRARTEAVELAGNIHFLSIIRMVWLKKFLECKTMAKGRRNSPSREVLN